MDTMRIRWAAIGAAVAITLGGGGLATVKAVSSGERAVFVPISPCRLFDTRAGAPVGTKATPLTTAEIYTVSGRGASGSCTLPADATALSLNVTAVGATLPTYLTLYPSDAATRPEVSSLNPVPGQGPTPNALEVDLSGAGQFNVFNLQGDVDVFADVNGYYVDHDHDDRYYTEAEVDAKIAALDAKVNGVDAQSAADVIAIGFVNAAAPAITEQRVKPGITLSVTNPVAGRIDLRVQGADTSDVPIVLITPHNPNIGARSCSSRLLSATAATDYTIRIDCYDGAEVGVNTSFQFAIMD